VPRRSDRQLTEVHGTVFVESHMAIFVKNYGTVFVESHMAMFVKNYGPMFVESHRAVFVEQPPLANRIKKTGL
jgi:hypothetical protein